MKITYEDAKHFGYLISRVGKWTASIDLFTHDLEISVADAESLLRWFKSRGCPIETVIIPELKEKGYRLNEH